MAVEELTAAGFDVSVFRTAQELAAAGEALDFQTFIAVRDRALHRTVRRRVDSGERVRLRPAGRAADQVVDADGPGDALVRRGGADRVRVVEHAEPSDRRADGEDRDQRPQPQRRRSSGPWSTSSSAGARSWAATTTTCGATPGTPADEQPAAIATRKDDELVTTTIQPTRRSSEAYGTEPGDPARAATLGGPGERLSTDQVTEFVTRTLGAADLDGKRVCLVVPDGTRTCPLPLLLTRRPGRAGRPGQLGHGGDRPRYPSGHGRDASGPPPRLPGRRRGADLSGLDDPQPRILAAGDVHLARHASAPNG